MDSLLLKKLLKSRTSVALEPIETPDRPLRTRIGEAIRRENYEENFRKIIKEGIEKEEIKSHHPEVTR